MFSEMLYKLLDNNLLQLGIWETIYMTVLSSLIAYVIGLPLGVILSITDPNGICPNGFINKVLGFVVNFFRSIPFIILMVAMLSRSFLIHLLHLARNLTSSYVNI
jgi:D-methionine transport system permease protein